MSHERSGYSGAGSRRARVRLRSIGRRISIDAIRYGRRTADGNTDRKLSTAAATDRKEESAYSFAIPPPTDLSHTKPPRNLFGSVDRKGAGFMNRAVSPILPGVEGENPDVPVTAFGS